MKLGGMSPILGGEDLAAAFAKAKRLRLAGVEAAITSADLADAAGWTRRVQALAREHGLAVPSLCLGEHNYGSLASADPSRVAKCDADIRAAVKMAAAVGAQVILVPFFFKGQVRGERAFEQVVAKFRELCPIAAAEGVTLAFEGELAADEIVRMCQAVGAPNFGCYFDLANVVWLGFDTATEVRRLGGWIKRVHMKESRVGPGDARPGLGRVDYAEAARALAAIGYDDWLILETPGGPFEWIARDASFTRRVFPQIKEGPAWPRLGAFSQIASPAELPKMIEDFRRWGLSCVQLSNGLLDACVESDNAAQDVAKRLRDAGIEVVGLGGYRAIVGRDEAQRRQSIEYLKQCLRLAPVFGTNIVATETGSMHPTDPWAGHPENFDEPAWKMLCDGLDELVAAAKENATILALEGYVNNVLQNFNRVQGLLDRYGGPHLGLMLDPFNYLSRRLMPAQHRVVRHFLETFEPYFVLAHLKDVAADGAESGTPEFGAGAFEYGQYFEFLRNVRPDLPIIFEHLPLENMPAAIARFRRINGLA